MSQARQTAVPGLRRRLASHRTRGTALRRPTACGVQQPPPRVVVLGGGFGGLYTALRLASLPWTRAPEVTLVDRSERFVFKPLLYELLTGQLSESQVAPLFAKLLANSGVSFRQARVTRVVPDCPLAVAGGGSLGGGAVELACGGVLPYDYLVVALGAEPAPEGVAGAREYALPFASYEDYCALRTALDVAGARRGTLPVRVAIVGGGLAGTELAAALCSRLRGNCEATLLVAGPLLLDDAASGQRAAAAAALAAAGVRVLTRRRVAAVAAGGTTTHAPLCVMFLPQNGGAEGGGGREPPPPLPADVVLWAAGQRRAGGLALSPLGPVEADSTLRLRGHERVFAVGDVAAAAAAGGAPLPATAQVAFQQADYAAWNVWALDTRRPMLPFRYQHLGEMMSLGADGAAVQLPPLPWGGPAEGVTLGGPLAALLRRAAYVYRMPTDGQRATVGLSWLQRGWAELQSAFVRGAG